MVRNVSSVTCDRCGEERLAALRLLQRLRERTGKDIRLAWKPDDVTDLLVIEVYPAATLTVHRLPWSGYKMENEGGERDTILSGLSQRVALPEDTGLLRTNADALDAVVCVLAADDFLKGRAMYPEDLEAARKGLALDPEFQLKRSAERQAIQELGFTASKDKP